MNQCAMCFSFLFTLYIDDNACCVAVFSPYFTVWVTSVQIIIFIVMLSVYGIAPISVQNVRSEQVVTSRSLVVTQ